MRISKQLLFVLLSTGICTLGTTQVYDSALHKLSSKFPQEKIYIHYDKDYYLAGETIWFKAYLFSHGAPSGISSNFFLQLIDPSGKLILQNKFLLLGAVAKGSIVLPDSLRTGNYTVRALTPEMLNDDPAFVYRKSMVIINSAQPPPTASHSPRNVSVQFFPESGDLVDGLLTVVAFKAVDQWGIPVEVEGSIRSDDGTGIAPFKTYHDGIGKTQFIPQKIKKYTAELEIDGVKKSIPLPDVQPKGVNLKVQDEKGGKVFQLAVGKTGKEEYDVLELVVEINNAIIYDNEIALESYPSVRGHLLTDSLPSGILHFTVFDKNRLPIAERLAFVDNHGYSSPLNLNVVKAGLERRAENNFELEFPDSIQRSCSVSITDASFASTNNNVENIYSRFLLTGDLKGAIYNPAWYFMPGDSVKQAIDNLLLTHGWSRFQWIRILKNEFPEKKFIDNTMINLTGNVNEPGDKLPVSGGKLNFYLQSEDSSSQSYSTEVDGKGGFNLKSISFQGKAKLYYAYTDSKGQTRPAKVHLRDDELDKMIGNANMDAANTNAGPLVNFPKDGEIKKRAEEISQSGEVKELEKVVVTTKSSKKPIDIVNEKYTSGVFRTMGKENIDNVNNPVNDKSMNAVDFIKNRIQQVEVQNGIFVNRKNISLRNGEKWTVGIFINESPSSVGFLRTIRADEIALVKFYEAGFVGVSSDAPGGAIAIYTKQVSTTDINADKMEFVLANGYAVSREFYHPDYSVLNPKGDKPDNRTTIYWNPDVYTDASTHSFPIHFFNNDYSKKFKVTVEGFDANGKLIHLEKIFGN